MNNQLQLVTFEQAKNLANLGFIDPDNNWDDRTFYYANEGHLCTFIKTDYHLGVPAPTVALALKWFRDKGLIGSVEFGLHDFRKGYRYNYINLNDKTDNFISSVEYSTYELAESALLDELILLLKNQNK